jgi:hypothetical protein
MRLSIVSACYDVLNGIIFDAWRSTHFFSYVYVLDYSREISPVGQLGIMEQEPEYTKNVEMPKFCSECGAEMVEILKIPNEIREQEDETEWYEELMSVCTSCDYEEVAEDEDALDQWSRAQWREINNAIPDVTFPRKVDTKNHVRVLGHNPFPPEYLQLYSHLLLAELAVQNRQA